MVLNLCLGLLTTQAGGRSYEQYNNQEQATVTYNEPLTQSPIIIFCAHDSLPASPLDLLMFGSE